MPALLSCRCAAEVDVHTEYYTGQTWAAVDTLHVCARCVPAGPVLPVHSS